MPQTSKPRIIVCDIDGTLCRSETHDYVNAVPQVEAIEMLNLCYDSGDFIILHTSRGMLSHNGDLEKINQKVRPVLETWLKQHGVKYHQLIMGKPYGDVYIDDKSHHPKEFAKILPCPAQS